MKNIFFLFLLFLISACEAKNFEANDTIFIAFWNLENLFDLVDDPNTDDQEFLPSSEKEWTQERLQKKMYNLARVITRMNNNRAPDVIGVCESENKAVLEFFTANYLKTRNYKIAYEESPDNRGIDCGLIYDSDKFELVFAKGHEIKKLKDIPTRLILHVELKTKTSEKVIFFVNHWPSRRGGASESEFKRFAAAEVLRREIDNLFKADINSKIIIMGDFNDDPVDESILKKLGAIPFKCSQSLSPEINIPNAELYNLSYNLFEQGLGTITYRDNWNLFDQIIISSALAKPKGLSYLCDSFSIINDDLVATRSGKFKGTPFPTYAGNRYLGGYSDHFPVTAKFIVRK